MKRSFIIIIFLFAVGVFAQESIDIQTCYKLAVENYPTFKQNELFKSITTLEKDNLNSQYLPKVNLIGQATYQSDVTKIDMDIPIPNLDIEFPEIDKDQYRIGITLDQMIWDGGIVSDQKRMAELNGEYNIQNNEIELYQLRHRVNGLFFGILKLQENIKIFETAIEAMNAKYKQIAVAVESGMALQSNADIIKAEILIAEQNLDMLKDSKKTAAESLSLLIYRDIKDMILVLPDVDVSKQEASNRPEYPAIPNFKRAKPDRLWSCRILNISQKYLHLGRQCTENRVLICLIPISNHLHSWHKSKLEFLGLGQRIERKGNR
jgi:outer membrane protein TolC